MKKLILTVAAMGMLSACTNTVQHDPWIGRTEEDVIARLGLPLKAYNSHDKKYMVYDLSKVSANTYSTSYYMTGCGYVSPKPCDFENKTTASSCQTMFILDGGEVENWTTTGRCGY